MGNKLYVGSLPYSTTEQQLAELFGQHGTVQSAKVMTDRYTGQSRGFGFVEMATDAEAQKAIAALNGTQMDGRTLVVNEARPQEKRPFGGGRGPGGGGGKGTGDRNRW
jgi:RNA recognition motif-containing protein